MALERMRMNPEHENIVIRNREVSASEDPLKGDKVDLCRDLEIG